MGRLYRFDARFTNLVAIGLVPDGLRLDASFEGEIIEGAFAGAKVVGIDYLRFRPDGVGVLDVRETLTRGADRVEVQAGGYLIPPPGFGLPPPDVILAAEFSWPDVELPVHGFATFRTGAAEWSELNHTVATFNGTANPGTTTLAIEAEALVPKRIAAPALVSP